MKSLFKREPAFIIGVFVSVLTLAAVFGFLKPDRADALKGVVFALAPLVGAGIIRQNVASPATVARTAVETAKGLSASTVGAVGEVAGAVPVITNVVGNVLGTTVGAAGSLVEGVLKGVL